MRKVPLGAALAFLALSLLGGYGLHWKWTGFSENGSVWDWLNLWQKRQYEVAGAQDAPVAAAGSVRRDASEEVSDMAAHG